MHTHDYIGTLDTKNGAEKWQPSNFTWYGSMNLDDSNESTSFKMGF